MYLEVFVPPRIFSKVDNRYLSPPLCPLFRRFATKYDVNMAGLALVTILKMRVNMRTLILFLGLLQCNHTMALKMGERGIETVRIPLKNGKRCLPCYRTRELRLVAATLDDRLEQRVSASLAAWSVQEKLIDAISKLHRLLFHSLMDCSRGHYHVVMHHTS